MTPEQIKKDFEKRGLTISDWARERGYHPNRVYQVLNGQTKAKWGTAHQIAIDLGLKPSPDAAQH